MIPHPTKFISLTLCVFSLLILLSCSKDTDILIDAILDDPITSIDERDAGENNENQTEETEETEEQAEEENMEDGFESRTTAFPPSNDAHVQSGKGYNQSIIRLDENNRTSYLMFDLSAIDGIGGYIIDATLQFTIDSDEGNGTINIYKGASSNWTESNLAGNTAPEIDLLLGTVTKEYKLGVTEEVSLSASDMVPEITTLILAHEGGNDLAIASKEHPSKIGPKLVVTYNAPEDAEEIVITEEEESQNDNEENEAPIAVADATPPSGGVPLEVSFTGSNSTDDKDITGYSWDFKNGSSSANANPVHTFTEIGTYEVELTVTDAEGLTNSDTVTITVSEEGNEAPVAVASATPLSGEAPLEVSFTGSNSTDDNSVSSYSWNFKNGSTSSNANPSQTFTAVGTYVVELTVQDENGLSDTASVTITVNQAANEAPVAVANASPLSGDAPLEVLFSSSNSTDDEAITSYFWDFNDNDPSSSPSPVRTFNTPGIYQVILTVTDAEGLSNSDTVTITVNDGNGGGNGNYPPGTVLASSFGYNSSNATEAFQDAINSNNTTIVIDKQNSDWIIEPSKFFNLRDKTIIFESGVVVRAKSGAFPSYTDRLIEFINAIDVNLEGYGATLAMKKSEYTSGEGRHALSLFRCRNLTIKGFVIKDSGGDGIYLGGGSSSGNYNENITIEDIVATNHRRVGLTIISAQNVWVRNSEFTQTSGTRPETGVQIEPNNASERLVNINFINCKFTNNGSNGFHIAPYNLNSSSIPMSIAIIDSEFSFNSLSSSNPKPKAEILLGSGNVSSQVGGEIRFERVVFNGSNRMVLFSKKPADAYNAVFKDCEARNVIQNGNIPAISLEALGTATTLGGYTFDNFYMEYNANQSFMRIKGPSNITVKDINGTFTIKEPYDNPLEYSGSYNPSNNVNVSISYNHIN